MKSKRIKITAIVLSVILVICSVPIALYFIFKKKLKYNKALGEMAVAIIDNAQYTPDMDRFIEVLNQDIGLLGSSENEQNLTAIEFQEIIDKYATIENYAGAGKYLGYDIYEIKEEIKFVVENVPAFNQWFIMPTMRESEGFISIPYYENWSYYLEMDEVNNILSITRVCWSTRSSYIDFENKVIVEEHDDGTSFIQYEIMKTNYYTNSDGDEVVECYIYSVGVDHSESGSKFNSNEQDYKPFEYQYLKNVKDKTLIKYHITVSERISVLGNTFSDYVNKNNNSDAMDVRCLNPYGIRREFMVVNYDGYTTIEQIFIDQQFKSYRYPNGDGLVNFDIESNNIKLLIDNIGVSQENYLRASSDENLMDIMSKHIIDSFEIKNNWKSIYKNKCKSIEVKTIDGPFKDKEFPITSLNFYIDASGGFIHYSAAADVYNLKNFDLDKSYSLSLALKNRETGKLHIVSTNYSHLSKTQYNGGSESDYYYRFDSSGFVNGNELNVIEEGLYDFVCVLTKKDENNNHIVMFDTLQIGYLRSYSGVTIPDFTDKDGLVYKYKVSGTGGRLVINVLRKV